MFLWLENLKLSLNFVNIQVHTFLAKHDLPFMEKNCKNFKVTF